jgi:hypothetical protein
MAVILEGILKKVAYAGKTQIVFETDMNLDKDMAYELYQLEGTQVSLTVDGIEPTLDIQPDLSALDAGEDTTEFSEIGTEGEQDQSQGPKVSKKK